MKSSEVPVVTIYSEVPTVGGDENWLDVQKELDGHLNHPVDTDINSHSPNSNVQSI